MSPKTRLLSARPHWLGRPRSLSASGSPARSAVGLDPDRTKGSIIEQLGTTRHGRRNIRFRRLSTFFVALVVFCAGTLVAATPASAGCLDVAIINGYTGLVVSAELNDQGFPGMLRARAHSIGPWEKFTRCIDQSTRVFTLKSKANGLYVSTEMNYGGSYQYMLRARATTVGPWEKFILYPQETILDAFTGYPGYWVTSEMNFPGSERYMLRANRKDLGEWEIWRFAPI